MYSTGNVFASGPLGAGMPPPPPPGVTQGAAAAMSSGLTRGIGGAVGGFGGAIGVPGGVVGSTLGGTVVGAPMVGGLRGSALGGVVSTGLVGGVGVGYPTTTLGGPIAVTTTGLRNSQVIGTRTGSPIPGPTSTFQGRVGPTTTTHALGAAYSPPHATMISTPPVVATGVMQSVVPTTTTVVRTSRAVSPGIITTGPTMTSGIMGAPTMTSGIMAPPTMTSGIMAPPTVVSGLRGSRTFGTTMVNNAVPPPIPPPGVMNSGFGQQIGGATTTVVTDMGYGAGGIHSTLDVMPIDKTVTVVETVSSPGIGGLVGTAGVGSQLRNSLQQTGTPLSTPPVGLIAPLPGQPMMGPGMMASGMVPGYGPCAQCCLPGSPCYPLCMCCQTGRRICGLPWWIPLLLGLLGLGALIAGLTQAFGGSSSSGSEVVKDTNTSQTTTNNQSSTTIT